MLKKCRGMQIRLKVRMTKELQCKIKPASIKKAVAEEWIHKFEMKEVEAASQ